MILNMNGGGGSSAKLFAAIGVTYPAGSTCTCSNGTKTFTAKNTSGQWVFAIPETGTWTVTCTDGDDSDSKVVEITAEGQSVSVELSYVLWLFNNGNECTDITGGWTSTGYTMASGSLVAAQNDGDSLNFYGVSEKTKLLGTENLISFSGKAILQIRANVISTYSTYPALAALIRTSKTGVSSATSIAKIESSGTGEQTLTLDVSAINEGYIVLYCSGSVDYKSEVSEIKLI